MNTSKNTNRTNSRKTGKRPVLTEQEQCNILEGILNRTGLNYSEDRLDEIDEAFGRFIALVI